MIHIKNEQEIRDMKHGGKILADVLFTVLKEVKPGVSEIELDALAEKLIRERGGEPGFQKVKGYHYAICTCTNDVVVHGIPRPYQLKEGDIICIDCGVYYNGLHTDMAETVLVQSPASLAGGSKFKVQNYEEKKKFLDTGKYALEEAIKVARAGNRIGHISKTIQDIVEGKGYSVVRNLIGHGVGKKLHEEPEVPGFLSGSIEKTPELRPGMTIAIEVIYNMGKKDVVYAGSDGWTIITKDKSLSSVFERSILITQNGPFILTS